MTLVDLILVIIGPVFTVLVLAQIARAAPDHESVADLNTWRLLNEPPPASDGDAADDAD